MTEVPEYLSPSSIATWRSCPMKFKFSRIDRILEPPSWATHVGTFVHEVLEHFYQLDSSERTIETIRSLAGERWRVSDWETQVNELEKLTGSIRDFKAQSLDCLVNLWKVENPQETELDGMEHEVWAAIDGVQMKGFIDRFIFDDEGRLIIGDYKTGKIPNPKFTNEDEKFFQLLVYALMLQEADQEETAKVQLLYLQHATVHEVAVTPVKLSTARDVIVRTKEGVEASCASEKFECNVTRLCDWCHYQSICPAHQK